MRDFVKRANDYFRRTSRSLLKHGMDTFFEDVHGTRLIKRRVSLLWYLVLYIIVVIVLVALDNHATTRRFLHSTSSNDTVIGITTILLALFIPVAIALIEDVRSSVISRQTIVRSVIRLAIMPVAIALICVFLLTPEGIRVFGNSITVRTLTMGLVLCCFYFLLMGFYRSYRWLSDEGLYSSGAPDTPPPDAPQAEAFTSYRFAQIVRLLAGAKGYETWIVLWQNWFPVEYENTLHTAFFRRQDDVLKNKRIKRYIVLSLEVEAYEKYYGKRNKGNWWFSDYLKQFLIMYSQIEKIIEADRSSATTAGLWRAKSALERLLKKMIADSMNRDNSWNLFEAMDEYLKVADLLVLRDDNLIRDDAILVFFITELLEYLLADRMNGSDVKSDLVERSHWLVTFDNLTVQRYNVSLAVERVFKNWLFKKLNRDGRLENYYAYDTVFGALFVGSDISTIADMYWFLFLSQNTVDAKLSAQLYYERARPFGVFGTVTETYWVEDEQQRLDNARKAIDTRREQAAKLFGLLYYQYFEQFWKLSDLIKAVNAAMRRKTVGEDEKRRLHYLLGWLKLIQGFYKTERAKAKKRK